VLIAVGFGGGFAYTAQRVVVDDLNASLETQSVLVVEAGNAQQEATRILEERRAAEERARKATEAHAAAIRRVTEADRQYLENQAASVAMSARGTDAVAKLGREEWPVHLTATTRDQLARLAEILGGGVDEPDQLIGKKVLLLANLAPATIMGIQSQGMVLAAATGSALELPQIQTLSPGTQIS